MKKFLKLTLLSAVIIGSASNLCLAKEIYFRGTVKYFDPNEGREIMKSFGDGRTPRITLDIDIETISKDQLKADVSTAADIPLNMFRIVIRGKDLKNLSEHDLKDALWLGGAGPYTVTSVAKEPNKARK